VVLGGGQDAMNVTMTDRRAGKFEAKFYHKVSSFLAVMLIDYFFYVVLLLIFICLSFRFCKKKLVVLKDILDQSMLWHLILMGGGNIFFSFFLPF
jgi:hypothetical protein